MTAALVPVAEDAAGAAGVATSGGAAAGGRPKRKGKGPAKKSRNLNDLETQEERLQELQRRKDEGAAPDDDEDQDDEHGGGVIGSANRMDPVHTGSGAVLGVLVFVVFRNYLEGGMPQVRRWGAAKFLNKTS